MKQEIQEFVQGRRFAIAGVSRGGKKFGNGIYKEMKERGYEMFIIHPEAQEIDGVPCYPSFSELPEPVDGAIICVTPDKASAAMREAAHAGIRRIWLQQGAQSPDALADAQALAIIPVVGKCILMYAQPVRSFHKVHRFFAQLFGGV